MKIVITNDKSFAERHFWDFINQFSKVNLFL